MRMLLSATALLATIVAAPVFAQTGTTGGTPTTTTAASHDDDGFDWGWLGLLGLAGLAPLFMRKDRTATIDRR